MDCITFTENGDEADLRGRLNAPAADLDCRIFYVSDPLKTESHHGQGRRMSARALPLPPNAALTGAWDMQKFLLDMSYAEGPAPARKIAAE